MTLVTSAIPSKWPIDSDLTFTVSEPAAVEIFRAFTATTSKPIVSETLNDPVELYTSASPVVIRFDSRQYAPGEKVRAVFTSVTASQTIELSIENYDYEYERVLEKPGVEKKKYKRTRRDVAALVGTSAVFLVTAWVGVVLFRGKIKSV